RKAIYAIYGFVRYADEIVDSFDGFDQETLLKEFERDYYMAQERGISLNPVLHAFQEVVRNYAIDDDLIQAFLKSMKMDLHKTTYSTYEDYATYIYGSADVVGLMCLKVFVDGDQSAYLKLRPTAMRLGSAFQKVNFLRDIKDDSERLERSYFPNVDFNNLNAANKAAIIEEIETDFEIAYQGIVQLPMEARLGVYTAYRYYKRLLYKIKKTDAAMVTNSRIRVSNPMKMLILGKSYIRYQFNIL
ncbi:MAG: squalene/phytoene synthase family protein, partial [Flavobacteriaceae bacterium]|nr:squalene/phytoene synthase family protein [Flavobacteriaceae bacterium]